jgi:hypothetical protein
MSGECDICGEHCLDCECHNLSKGKMEMEIKSKERIVRDLMSTFEDRNELHAEYKQRMKDIILISISYVLGKIEEHALANDGVPSEIEICQFVNEFVENHFEMAKE